MPVRPAVIFTPCSTLNMANIAQKPNNLLEDAATSAAGANIDGRGRNIVFKHKQLIRLFGERNLAFAMTTAHSVL